MSVSSLLAHGYYHNEPYVYDAETSAVAAGAILVFILFALVLSVAFYIVSALLLGRIFKKAGIESWKAWVPVYNSWILLELGDQKGYWAVLAVVPIINIVAAVFMYIAMYRVGLKFGKDGAFVLLAIFLPLVWFMWLALDNSTWEKSKPHKRTHAK